jgi:hypothetical protein
MSTNKYIYESPDGGKTVTKRPFGVIAQDISSLPGFSAEDFDSRTPDGRPLHEHLKEADLWSKIRRAAETNPALHEALERAKVIYHLSKE